MSSPVEFVQVPRPALERLAALDSLEEREQRYRELTELLPQTVFEMDLETNITFVNQVFFSLFRYTREDFRQGICFSQLCIPEEQAKLRQDVQSVLKEGKSSHEHMAARKDGSTFPIIVHFSPIVRNGCCVGFRGIVADLSEQKRRAESLRQSEETYRAIFEHTGTASLMIDEDGSISLANTEWVRLTGWSREECVGLKRWMEFVVPQELPRLKKLHWNWFQGLDALPLDYETRIMTRDGRIRDVIAHIGLIPGTRKCIASLADITESKQLAAERVALEERLRQSEKLEAIGQLAGGVAHDFNNHLSAILGFAGLLQDRVAEPALRRYVENITTSCQRAADLTKQLLAFARKGKYLSVPVDMHTLIREVVSLLEHSIDRRIVLEERLLARISMVKGDPSLLQNAIMNLALNARDAMASGGRLIFSTSLVELAADDCRQRPYEMVPGTYLRIHVTDTGCGMDAETRNRIFEPFFTTKEVGKGTGLGLPSVYGAVKQHRGSISVYSEPGRGTCFKVDLPVIHAECVVVESEAPAVGGDARILVIDDEPLVAEAASEMLKGLGYQVQVCPDGLRAVEFFRTAWTEIDLVILDMVMPRFGGRETFLALQEIHPGVRVLLSSGFSVDGEAQELLDAGAGGFLQKPFLKKELARSVAELCR